MKFLDYQTRWINDTSRMKVLEKSRRIGGTYSTSYGKHKKLMKRKGHDITVVTRDENLAVEFIRDVQRWGRMWNAISPVSWRIPEKHFQRLSFEIPHAGGPSRLIAVSSNPNAVIGRGGSLVLDELAAHKDPELLMRLAQPIIMAGGDLDVLSTQRGRNTKFNEIVIESQTPGSEWSHHKTTIYDAVEQGLVEEIINPNMIKLEKEPWKSREDFLNWLRATYDEHTFNQEFLCIPSDDATSLLSFDDVQNAKKHYEEEGELKQGVHYLGYDCAESINGDFSTICILKADNENNVELIEALYFERGTSITEQIDTVVRMAKKYHVRRVVSDNAGIGRHPTTIIGEKLGEHMVVAFDPTLKSKGEMCTKAKRYFQNTWVRMKANKHVEDDFLSIDRLITASGNIVYHANRSSAIGHGDMFSAFAQALTEVPEVSRSEIKGISAKKADPFDVISGRDHRDMVAQNRADDRKGKKKKSY